MNKVAELEKTVRELSQQEYREFRQRFLERDGELWDGQIEQDATTGKLDFLVQEAIEEKNANQLKPL
ncbi:MAG: hypothetical protein P9L94_12975 [Candidatus Hinthialibacter antarcticus]|nr:hypothetical protein [Candidatus Hinthialibacter antarcticus]